MKYERECIKTMELVESYNFCIMSKQTNELTLLFLTMDDWIDETMNGSYEVWMWVHKKYGVSWIIQHIYLVKTNKFAYLAVPKNGRLDWRRNEWEWWSMNASASKLWNELNHTKIVFSQNKTNAINFSDPDYFWLNQWNNKSYELKCKSSKNNNWLYKNAL